MSDRPTGVGRGRQLEVAMGDVRVSLGHDDVLITRSLGSCVAIVLHAPKTRLGGMVHCSLPDSGIDRAKAMARPGLYVDSAVNSLVRRALALGASPRELVLKLVGGGAPLNDGGVFQIGRRNVAAARKALWRRDLFFEASDVGGKAPRTVTLHVGSGRTVVKTHDREFLL